VVFLARKRMARAIRTRLVRLPREPRLHHCSADHTGNARWTIIDGKPIVFQGGNVQLRQRPPLDVSFLLDPDDSLGQGADKRFAGPR